VFIKELTAAEANQATTMFSIFKKKSPAVTLDLSALQTDMHSHLLPGIDDGSPDVATSMLLIQGLQELGYRQFITTPHILWDLYKNTPTIISEAEAALQPMLQQIDPSVRLKSAAEYYLDDHIDQLLNDNSPLLTIHANMVLIEFSFVSPPLDWKQKIFNLQMHGYQPVLAHPERYAYFAGSRQVFEALKNAGCLFQVNLLSFTGYYNKVAQELAHYLVKNKWVDLLGTDLHHERHLSALRQSGFIAPVIQELLDSGKLLNPDLAV
jgi:protein-tyrosine phosphatase